MPCSARVSAKNGLAQYDLTEVSLAQVVDDARSLSLFAAQRVILVSNAEAALPRTKADEEDDAGGPAAGGAGELAAYLKDPSPGVVLLLEATRFEFAGDEKKKLERVRKFYAAVAETVELERFSMDEARTEAQALARHAQIAVDPGALALLVEALGGDVARIAVEIEKLSLYRAGGSSISEDDITAMVPDARSTTIFALVNALGPPRSRPRARAAWIRYARRRVSAAGLGVSLDTIPAWRWCRRKSGLRSFATDCGAFLARGRADVELARRAGLSNCGQILKRAVWSGV